MNSIEPLSPFKKEYMFPWRRYLLDSTLAIVGASGVTGIIAAWHLYPRIPNISIVYLLVVLPLASTRGRYSATLASVVAFLTFDFFIVPPLYTFVMYHVEEWIALSIFLISALLTGHLAAALSRRAEEASRRERETRALYNLVRKANSKEEPEDQLRAISHAIVEVFAPWGVQDCAILQPDASGMLQVQPIFGKTPFSSEEQVISVGAGFSEQKSNLENPQPAQMSLFTRLRRYFLFKQPVEEFPMKRSLHLIPLKLGKDVVGALRLYVLGDPRALLQEEHLTEDEAPTASTSFFWTFLGQVAALLERLRLQRENMRLAVLQRTDALRAALLSSVSHDLRTPLTSIKASASSLLQEEVQWTEETQRGFLQSIEHEADRLNRLVENLLDMSRIEEGELKPDKDWYSLKALIQDVLGRLEPLFEGRIIKTHFPENLLMVELDYLEIDQVLTNLLENAVRYTPVESPIEISARLEREQVVVSVEDRGPGIPSEHLEHVFDKFYRVLHETPDTGYSKGSGLGLAVCKGLVEAHKGRIWAEQRAEGGLAVFVALPIGEPERMPV